MVFGIELTADVVMAAVAVVSLVGGALYWLYQRANMIATQEFVESQLESELEDVKESTQEALEKSRENQEELEHLRDLIEGGNSQFEEGLMDYLEQNIEKVDQIRSDLSAISDEIDEVRRNSRRNEGRDEDD